MGQAKQRKDRGEYPTQLSDRLVVKETACGRGLFASRDIPAGLSLGFGGVLIPFVSDLCVAVDVATRATGYSDIKDALRVIDDYHARISSSLVGCPTRKDLESNKAGWWITNHACFPNARFGGDTKNGVCIVPLRDIKAGEELTVFYGWEGRNESVKCLCGHPECYGTIERSLRR